MSDEQRERLLISEQIARAAEASSSVTPPDESSPPAGLQREEGDAPVKLSFALKKKLSPDPSDAIMSTPIDQPVTVSTPAPIKLTPKVNPLKANVFKMAKSSFNSSIPSASKREREAVPVALRLIEEEQERKRRKMDREGTKIST
jgi:DNA/RNA-binding protein KIN17